MLTIGTNNGYANGPTVPMPIQGDADFRNRVKLGGYYEDYGRKSRATVAFQGDGKLWVSDTATGRLLRFETNGNFDTTIMYIPHAYRCSVDMNCANRVFGSFLEFHVNYAQSVSRGWVLTNYWGHDLITTNGTRTNLARVFPDGLLTVTTITNSGNTNRTFALIPRPIDKTANPGQLSYEISRLVELTAGGLKETLADFLDERSYELDSDGAVNQIQFQENPVRMSFVRRTLAFTDTGIPFFTSIALLTTNTYLSSDPTAFKFVKAGTNFVLLSRFKNHTGFHLGAVATNASTSGTWSWKTAPSGNMDGMGNFDLRAVDTVGEQLSTIGSHIVFVYRGEFWKGILQANQLFHYSDCGAFLGQFGTPLGVGSAPNPPGSANNLFTCPLTHIG